MALLHAFESQGNWLFRYRGQLPVLLFPAAVPAILLSHSACPAWLEEAALLTGILASLTGFLIRSYTIGTTPAGTSGRNTEKQVAEQLNTKGIYSVVRHPLYVGNYLMWAGIVVSTVNLSFFIIMSLAFWLYYERIMFAEERFLEKKFGQPYLDWSLKVPAFIPRLSGFQTGNIPFSWVSVLRREYSGVLATVTGFAYVEVLKNFKAENRLFLDDNWIYILAVTAGISLLLKFLKNKTTLLAEAGRS